MKHPLKDLANPLHRPVESAARTCPSLKRIAFLEAVVENLLQGQLSARLEADTYDMQLWPIAMDYRQAVHQET